MTSFINNTPYNSMVHLPLSTTQRVLLTAGSAVGALLNPLRGNYEGVLASYWLSQVR